MRTSTRLPWFQFFPADWLADTMNALLTVPEKWGRFSLICHCWTDPDCSIPDDDQALARLSELGDQWANGSGKRLRQCFMAHPKKPGRLTDGKLYKEFLRLKGFFKERSASGTKGAQSRWKDKQLNKQVHDGSAIAQPMAQPMLSDGNSDSDSEKKRKEHTLSLPEERGRVSSFLQEAADGQDQDGNVLWTQARQKQYAALRPEASQAAFELFWQVYPNKVAPGPVEEWFREHPVTPSLIYDMECAIKQQVKTPRWIKDEGRWIPEPMKWLEQKRWRDEGVKVKSQRDRILNVRLKDKDYTAGAWPPPSRQPLGPPGG